MDVARWCTATRIWVVAGKGGVGKSTTAAALAAAAAGAGLSVLLVELEGKPTVPAAFGRPEPLTYTQVVLAAPPVGAGASPTTPPADPPANGEPAVASLAPGTVAGRCITPDDALLEYLGEHGLQRVSRRLVSSGVIDVVATAIPGIRDVLVLGKIKQLERSEIADVVVLDAPATGHAMTFLTSAQGLLDAARSGPVRNQAADVVEMLQDPARCRVLLVTLPEELPVSETVEAAYLLEDRAGVQLGPVVVNGWEERRPSLAIDAASAARSAGVTLAPAAAEALDRARTFQLTRQALADDEVERLGRELPLPQLRLPKIAGQSIGPAELQVLAAAFRASVESLPTPATLP